MSTGQIIGGVGGAFIGFWLGGPAGAVKGAYWGYMAGSIVDPQDLPKTHGPRLEDLKAQTSTVGAPIPMVFGTYAISGNVLWASDLIETKHKDTAGGKGSPSQKQISYTYSQSMAIGLCEAAIPGGQAIQGIRKIWANGKLIYDRSKPPANVLAGMGSDVGSAGGLAYLVQKAIRNLAASDNLDSIMTVYDGTQTAADPTIEAIEGVGNVPAFKDLAYVVFDNLQLADYGNRAPEFLFEVYTSGNEYLAPGKYSNAVLYPWVNGIGDPRNPLNDHSYWNGSAYVSSITGINAPKDYVYGYSPQPNGVTQVDVTPDGSITWGEPVTIYALSNIAGVSNIIGTVPVLGSGPAGEFASMYAALGGVGVGWINGLQSPGVLGWEGDSIVQVFVTGDPYWTAEATRTYAFTYDIYTVAYWDDAQAPFKRVPRQPINPVDLPGAIPIPDAPDVVLIDGSVYRAQDWSYVTGTFKVLAEYAQTDTFDESATVSQYPLNPCIPSTSEYYSDEAYWTAAYDAAVVAGDIVAGLTYGVDYPVGQAWAYENSHPTGVIDVLPVLVSDIVSKICQRSGMATSQIDVTDIDSTTDGYAVSGTADGRAAINPLMMFGLFGAFEADGKIVFRERGGAVAVTFSADELRAHASDSEAPSAVEVTRRQDIELPRTIRVTYGSPTRDYQPGEQQVNRLTTSAINAEDVQLPLAMTDTKALHLAEIYMFDSWTARNGYVFSVSDAHLARTPTDVAGLPVDGNTERVRIISCDSGIPGVIKVEAIRDDADVLTSYATVTADTTEANATPSDIPLPGPTDLVLLDLPSLRAGDNDAGYYAAGRGYLPTWSGFSILQSFDGGTEYTTIATSSDEATMGALVESFAETALSITVDLASGTFASATEEQLDAGANVLAIGAHGRWELLQFAVASLNTDGTWELSDFRRGLRGSTDYEATSVADDRVVLVSGKGILRVPLAASLVNVAHLVKAVSIGTTAADTTAVSFTSAGLSLQAGGLTYDGNDNLVADEIYRQVFGT